MFNKKRKIEPLCANCRLFNERKGECQVVVLHEGQRLHLPVSRQDTCFFENEFSAIGNDGSQENFKVAVNEVKFWVETPEGKKTKGNGIVKMEYPKAFFGVETNDRL